MKEDKIISKERKDYLKGIRKKKTIISIVQILILLILLSIWEIAARIGIIDSFITSQPSRILNTFMNLTSNDLIKHICVTFYETIVGFFIGSILGYMIAIILWWSDYLSKIFEPYLVVLNALPKSALAPLIIVWLGTGTKTIIIAGISVAVFGSIMNLYSGFKQVDREKIKLIKTLGGTKKDEILKIIIPSSIPVIISNMKVNIGLALVGVIIGEFLAARNGLGYLIIYGSQGFQLDLLILSIVILCIIAMLLYKSISYLENKIMKSGLF